MLNLVQANSLHFSSKVKKTPRRKSSHNIYFGKNVDASMPITFKKVGDLKKAKIDIIDNIIEIIKNTDLEKIIITDKCPTECRIKLEDSSIIKLTRGNFHRTPEGTFNLSIYNTSNRIEIDETRDNIDRKYFETLNKIMLECISKHKDLLVQKDKERQAAISEGKDIVPPLTARQEIESETEIVFSEAPVYKMLGNFFVKLFGRTGPKTPEEQDQYNCAYMKYFSDEE